MRNITNRVNVYEYQEDGYTFLITVNAEDWRSDCIVATAGGVSFHMNDHVSNLADEDYEIAYSVAGGTFICIWEVEAAINIVREYRQNLIHPSEFPDAARHLFEAWCVIGGTLDTKEYVEAKGEVSDDDITESYTRENAQTFLDVMIEMSEQVSTLRSGTSYFKPINPDNAGYVYLLQSPSTAFKIGRSRNPKDRLKTFGVKLPFEVEFIALIKTPDMYRLENILHQRFAKKRIKGEWFRLNADDIDYIVSLQEVES